MSSLEPENNERALDRYFDHFGDSLAAAAAAERAHDEHRASRRRRWIFAGGAGVAVAAVLAVLLLPSSVTPVPGGFVAQAQAALSPPDEIVHMTVTSTLTENSRTTSQTTEQWSATDPTRWRLVQTVNPSATGTVRDDLGGVISGRQEFAYANGVQERFLVERNILDIAPAPTARNPGVFGLPNDGDPAAELRAAVSTGRVQDQGERVDDGRKVRRLASSSGEGDQARNFVYNVDPVTFAPISGELRLAKAPGVVFGFRVDAYERLPLTAESADLLVIKTNSETTTRRARP